MNDVILEDVNIPKVPVHPHPPQESIRDQRVTPFLERLVIEKPVVHPEYNILNELKNICVKIPLLQDINSIELKTLPSYAILTTLVHEIPLQS